MALNALWSPGAAARWLRAVGRRLCLLLVVAGLPLQGMATAVGTIDGVAHVHRAGPERAAPARPLPPGMPVLLSVDELRHSHGAPRRRAEPSHHHAGVAHHRHAADDPSVVAVADPGGPADDTPAQGSPKRLLLDVDTPPAGAQARAGRTASARPPLWVAAHLPDPAPDRLERPPRNASV